MKIQVDKIDYSLNVDRSNDGILIRCFPYLTAKRTNREIDKRLGIKSTSTTDDYSPTNEAMFRHKKIISKWEKELKNSDIEENELRQIAHDIFQDNEQRIRHIENKGSWMLIGIGLIASIISLFASITFNNNSTIFGLLIIAPLLFTIPDIVFSFLGIYKGIRITTRYGLSSSSIMPNIELSVLRIAIIYFSALNTNYHIDKKKINFIMASQMHFTRGLKIFGITFIISIILLVLSIYNIFSI